jgi:hypothetical protein
VEEDPRDVTMLVEVGYLIIEDRDFINDGLVDGIGYIFNEGGGRTMDLNTAEVFSGSGEVEAGTSFVLKEHFEVVGAEGELA